MLSVLSVLSVCVCEAGREGSETQVGSGRVTCWVLGGQGNTGRTRGECRAQERSSRRRAALEVDAAMCVCVCVCGCVWGKNESAEGKAKEKWGRGERKKVYPRLRLSLISAPRRCVCMCVCVCACVCVSRADVRQRLRGRQTAQEKRERLWRKSKSSLHPLAFFFSSLSHRHTQTHTHTHIVCSVSQAAGGKHPLVAFSITAEQRRFYKEELPPSFCLLPLLSSSLFRHQCGACVRFLNASIVCDYRRSEVQREERERRRKEKGERKSVWFFL